MNLADQIFGDRSAHYERTGGIWPEAVYLGFEEYRQLSAEVDFRRVRFDSDGEVMVGDTPVVRVSKANYYRVI